MNKIALSTALILFGVSAFPQEPPGCSVKSTASSRTTKQMKSSPQKKEIKGKLTARARTSSREEGSVPVIASPIYLPQSSGSNGSAITASNGYLYIVVGKKLYKVGEHTMRVISVTDLETPRAETTARRSEPAKKVVASKGSTRKRTKGSS